MKCPYYGLEPVGNRKKEILPSMFLTVDVKDVR
jgi:hypothetical protein